ncbi:alpha/beta hydrolase [Streptomyces sp. NPDC041068]|uniref:alpha/beta fold hydrolase n=1 Tax=Streptomyces sp. NPDC041068 TaxID=3155130 RepID=UPI00340D561A
MPHATVNGIRLFHTDGGTGAPVLFLHGWGTSGRAWDAQVADLETDHRVVTVDWRGCGRSDRPATGNTLAANVADILALMDVLALDGALLVGSSIGAAYALEAAIQAPDRVAGVVSVDGSGHWPTLGMADTLRAMRTSLATDRAATLAGWVPEWFGPDADPDLAAETIRQIHRSGTHIDELLTDAASHDPRETLGLLRVPALFVHGLLDSQIPVEVSGELAALAPHGELHVIEDAGHMPHQERPAAVNALLRTALARAVAAPGPSA